jgi:predicted AAA+ superfamily ATPase
MLKGRLNQGERSNLYFWRDRSGHEIDVIIDQAMKYQGVEIEISKTFNKIFLKNLNYLAERDEKMSDKIILWGSESSRKVSDYELKSWREIDV